MATMNDALLTKWWWRLLTEPDLLWTKLTNMLYYYRRKPLQEGRTFKPASQWWKSVVRLREVFKCGVSYKLGDGRLVDFWSHRWCGEISLQSLLPELFNKVERKVCNVKDCFSTNGWRWRKILKGTESESQRLGRTIQEFRELLSNFHTVNSRDDLCWRWNKGQGFTVKSVYEMLNDGGVKDDLPDKIWRLRVPMKVKIFIWLVLKKRIPTIDNLNKRGWTGNQSCVLCACAQETVDHLLLTCVFSRFLMACIFDEAMDVQFGDDVRGLWEKEMERGNGQAAVKRQCSLAAIWWVLWRQRNNVIFRNLNSDPLEAARICKELVKQWAENC